MKLKAEIKKELKKCEDIINDILVDCEDTSICKNIDDRYISVLQKVYNSITDSAEFDAKKNPNTLYIWMPIIYMGGP